MVVKQVRSTASDGRVGASVSSAIAGFGLERTREIRENLKIAEKRERFYVGFNCVKIGVLNLSLMADVAFSNWLA